MFNRTLRNNQLTFVVDIVGHTAFHANLGCHHGLNYAGDGIYISPHHHHHQWYVHIAQCANSVAMPQSETPNLDLPPTQFWATDDHTKRDRDDGRDVDERMIDNIRFDNYQEHMSKHQSQGHR